MGGIGSTVLFSPISLVTCIPTAAAGTVYGLGKGIVEGIRKHVTDKDFRQEVALHLYQWIDATKTGRMNLRKEIQTWHNDHEDTSIKAALSAFLKNDQLSKNCDNAHLNRDDIKKIIDSISNENDNYEHFFPELSKQVKVRWLNDDQWTKLQNTLVHWSDTYDFPVLTDQDIKDHLYFAVYLFDATNNNSRSIIETFLKQ